MMITLVNTNRMLPPIAPVGLEYVAGAVSNAGIEVELLDLCLAENPADEISRYFSRSQPELVGLSFRNVDDCFWPSGQSFLDVLKTDVAAIAAVTDAPLAIGGVGFSIFAGSILRYTGADFGIRGDGERALVQLVEQLERDRNFESVAGLVYRDTDGVVRQNPPAWPREINVQSPRDMVDNATYFRRGGQIGIETKRGCHRSCIYCADPLAKGRALRTRDPSEVADEFEGLLERGIDVFHLCDAEFNLPEQHALAVCDELIARRLGDRMRWYAYLAVMPFSDHLAYKMRKAGCVGINFTSDAAHAGMLETYRQPHRAPELSQVVCRCRQNGIAVMLDMLLGGPGETVASASQTVEAFRQIDPDCAGASVGVRIYPNTEMAHIALSEGDPGQNPNIRRHYPGHVDFLLPTFYISAALGEHPAEVVSELIGKDERFFPPLPESDTGSQTGRDHNYNANESLVRAIASGERGAYWDILRKRDSQSTSTNRSV